MKGRQMIAALLAVAMLAGACGDDDSGPTSAAPDSTVTPEETTSTPPDAGPAPTGSFTAWFTNWESAVVGRMDLDTGECLLENLGLSADLVAVGLGYVWATDCTGGQLVRIDPETHQTTGRIDLGGCAADLLVRDEGLWVSIVERRAVVEVDPETGEIITEIQFQEPVWDIAEGSMLAVGVEMVHVLDDLHAAGSVDAADIRQITHSFAGTELFQAEVCGDVTAVIGAPLDRDPAADDATTTIYALGDPGGELASLPGAWDGFFCDRENDRWVVWSLGLSQWGWIPREGGELVIMPFSDMAKPAWFNGLWIPWGTTSPGIRWRSSPAESRDFDQTCVDPGTGQSIAAFSLALADAPLVGSLAEQRAGMDDNLFPTVDAAVRPAETVGQAAGFPGPDCTSVGWSVSDRTLSAVFSIWEEDGLPAAGRQIELSVAWTDGRHVVGTEQTGADGRAVFDGPIGLDSIGAPTGATVEIIQAPVVEGEAVVNPACIGTADV